MKEIGSNSNGKYIIYNIYPLHHYSKLDFLYMLRLGINIPTTTIVIYESVFDKFQYF